MRSTCWLVALSAVALAVPSVGLADEPKAADTADFQCDIHAGKDDVVEKGKDVVIEAGRTVRDALAVNGNVLVKRGAKVHSAVALNGTVTVEEGAVVEDSAVAFHGQVKLAAGAQVKGSRVWIDKGLHVIDEKGNHVNVELSIGGVSLSQWLLESVLKDFHGCHVVKAE